MNHFSTIQELLAGYAKKAYSNQEVDTFYRTRLATYNNKLNCALEIFDPTSENATSGTKKSEPTEQEAAQKSLAGVPCLIKDNICQENRITSAGSRMLQNYRAPYDATAIKKLKQAGAALMGRTNMDEFAMGGSGEFSAYGPTKNPWDLSRSPGGSSSGSAAAVAAGLAPFALGSETGGSVRQPASFCNLVGMYPTYGRVSRFGLMAFASSTDQIGAITRTVYDNALVMSVISGYDKNDMTSINEKSQDYTAVLAEKLPAGLRVGILRDAIEGEGIHPDVRARFDEAVKTVENLGIKVSIVDIANLKHAIALYFIINYAEAASNLSRFDGSLYGLSNRTGETLTDMYIKTRHDGFGDEVKRRILLGNYVLSAGHRDAYYVRAQNIRALIRQEFEEAFKTVDVLMSPTSSMLPFKLGTLNHDPIAMYMADYFTVPNCMTGTPAISVPAGFSTEGLPIGVQFLGARGAEKLLYQIAYAFEQETGFYTKTPQGFE